MNFVDRGIIAFLNGFAHRSQAFDLLVIKVSGNDFLKTAVITALLVWAWFLRDERSAERRQLLTSGVIAACAAVLAARILSLMLPFRERPLRNPTLHFVLPYSVGAQDILGWSAFPSDNAVLFFALAMCLFLVSRRAGIVAFCHVSLVVAFARIYLGYHYPTDVLGGALLGVGAVSLVRGRRLRETICRKPLLWMENQPEYFYPASFLLLFLVGTTFWPLYPLASLAVDVSTSIITSPFVDLALQQQIWILFACLAATSAATLASMSRLRRDDGRH